MAEVTDPRRDVRRRNSACSPARFINLAVLARLSSACGGFGPDYPPSDLDFLRDAESAVERYCRVIIETIE